MRTHRLPNAPDVPDALRAVAGLPHACLLDSARLTGTARWSFLAADPVAVVRRPTVRHGDLDWVRDLRRWAACFDDLASKAPGRETPPFTGGLAGVLSYELGHAFERLDRPAVREFDVPALCVGVYDWAVTWDHHGGGCRVFSTGLRADGTRSERQAERRLNEVLRLLASPPPAEATVSRDVVRIETPQHPVPAFPGVFSNFSPEGYAGAVDAVREHIAAGDIFQANLAQRLLAPATCPPVEQFVRLRRANAAPMAGYFDGGDWQLLSASPERFVEVTAGGLVETRPIKGTRKRSPRPEADLYVRDELRQSEKDRAENVMIVDLMRNDLARVCRTGSVEVPQLCEVETFETVQHLVSSVTGRLAEGADCWDLVAAAFPGGSITGCPKIRSMDVITALEGVARGPYCGSLFYQCGVRFDASILIRSMIRSGGWLQLPVGGGVTYASNAADEYRETLVKAEAMVQALS